MLAILAPILVFGLVIFVHELGHFLAAKATGVYAPRFSIGFGPAIFRFRRGETEYVLAWLPLGGYVRMASKHDAETAFLEGGNESQTTHQTGEKGYDPNAMMPFGPKPVPEDRWFESKPLWARLLIMIAGVTMNIVLAIVVATIMAFHYGRPVYPSTVIGGVRPVASAPNLSGLQAGDTIRAVNGKPVKNWDDIMSGILAAKNTATITTQRNAVQVPVGTSGESARDVASALQYNTPAVIDSVTTGDPADRAGLVHGDSVILADGKQIRSWSDMVDAVEHSTGSAIQLVVRRAGALDTISVTPKLVESVDSATGKKTMARRIGVSSSAQVERIPVTFADAVNTGLRITWTSAGAVVTTLNRITTGDVSIGELSGPIAITRASVTAAQSGIDELLYLIALLSVNLAVLNLLPIPLLDGGQILINVLEAGRGKAFSMRTREYILRFGLLAIGLLFVVVMYNDTHSWLSSIFKSTARLFR